MLKAHAPSSSRRTQLGSFWGKLETADILSSGEVHVWVISLDLISEKSNRALDASLSKDERARSKKFLTSRDRMRFLASRAVLRAILGHYLGIGANQVHFRYSSRGKPSLVEKIGKREIDFGLAHSRGLALYAFTLNHEVGVDIEYAKSFTRRTDQIVKRFFSKQEKAAYDAIKEKEKKNEAFFRYWTIKEAFLKAIGVGLAYPLDKIDILLAKDGNTKLLSLKSEAEEPSRWYVREVRAVPDYFAAVVVHDLASPKIVLKRVV